MRPIVPGLALLFCVATAVPVTAAVYNNPVVPSAELGEFRHGTYPSIGKRTHVGVDLVAGCGTPVYAFEDGRVIDLVESEEDEHFNSLGYMALIQHDVSEIDKPFATLYLHLKNKPLVKKNETVKAGQEIGEVGDTGFSLGCHLHFEVRNFLTRFNMADGWKNIYGSGDQRNSEVFKRDWEDPEPLLAYALNESEVSLVELRDQTRAILRKARIGYRNLGISNERLVLRVRRPTELNRALEHLRVLGPNVVIQYTSGGDITITPAPLEEKRLQEAQRKLRSEEEEEAQQLLAKPHMRQLAKAEHKRRQQERQRLVLLEQFPLLSQKDAANYRDQAYLSLRDTTIDGSRSELVPNLACLAAVYTMLERGRGKSEAMIDDYYPDPRKFGGSTSGPERLPYVSADKPIDLSAIKASLSQNKPVILRGTGGPLFQHFVLVVGVQSSKDGTSKLVALDPWPGSDREAPGQRIVIDASIQPLEHPTLPVIFRAMRQIQTSVQTAPRQPAVIASPSTLSVRDASEELSRDEAKRILRSYFQLPEPIAVHVPNNGVFFSFDKKEYDAFLSTIEKLSKDGYITYRIVDERVRQGEFSVKLTSAISKRGKAYVMQDRVVADGVWREVGTFIAVRGCEVEISRVTGIRKSQDSTAVVEFMWQKVNPTPFVKLPSFKPSIKGLFTLSLQPPFSRECDELGAEKPASKSVTLDRYDDGWRVRK